MAQRSASLKIAIDGEKAYKESIAEITRQNKTLGAEMQKLAAEYKGNETSVEALTKKQGILDRQLLESNAKVEETRKQLESWRQTLEKVKAESGATSDDYKTAAAKVQEYEASLARAETQQIKIQNSINETATALENQGKITLTVGDTVDQLASKLGINLPKGATDALNGTVSFSAGTVAAMGAAAGAVAALIKVIEQLHSVTLEAAADVDELVSESMVTGLSTQTLQQLKYAENLIDVSSGTITASLTKLTANMAKARDGNDKLADAFAALGVSITDASGQLRPAEEAFYEVVDALGAIENGTERDAAAMEILGKSAQDLNPLILQGSQALRELAEEAESTGYILDESQIQKLAEVDDAYQRMQLQVEAVKKELAVKFAPALKAVMDTFGRVVQTAAQTLAQSGIIENLASMVTSTMSMLDTATALIDAMPGWMNPITQVSNAFRGLAIIMATIADTANVVSGLLTRDFNRVKTGLGMNLGSGQMSNLQQLKYSSSDYVWYNAAGDQNWRGGLTWVGENGPELVELPRGSRIYNAQESREKGNGQTVFNITVANIQELNEIVDWYNSRRVTERMK